MTSTDAAGLTVSGRCIGLGRYVVLHCWQLCQLFDARFCVTTGSEVARECRFPEGNHSPAKFEPAEKKLDAFSITVGHENANSEIFSTPFVICGGDNL